MIWDYFMINTYGKTYEIQHAVINNVNKTGGAWQFQYIVVIRTKISYFEIAQKTFRNGFA